MADQPSPQSTHQISNCFAHVFFTSRLPLDSSHRQLDSLLLQVHAHDLNVYDIANADCLKRMLDVAVGKLGNVNQTILVYADVYESTEVDYVTNGSF